MNDVAFSNELINYIIIKEAKTVSLSTKLNCSIVLFENKFFYFNVLVYSCFQPPTDQTFYRTRPFTEFWVVSLEHLRRMWHADRGRLLPPDTWSCPIWDLHLFCKPKPHYLLVTLTEYDLFTEIYNTEWARFQQNICNGCGMPAGDADSSGHLVPSLWDLHMFYLLRPILFRTCRYFTGLCSSNIPRYFLDFTSIVPR